MIRTSEPASAEVTRATSPERRSWYFGAFILASRGRFTQSWMPWKRPPCWTSHSGGASMWRMPAPGGHPLGVAVGDGAATTVAVLVVEGAVDDVGDGLEAAVRVPGRALRLTGRVLDLAHLVHHHERVEVGEVDAGEGAADREALPLEALRARSSPAIRGAAGHPVRARAVGPERSGR